MPYFTVGHSNYEFETFAQILKSFHIDMIIDVRKIPKSKKFPHFGIDQLPGLLHEEGIKYRHFDSLGGRRPKSKIIPDETNGFWDNQSFHNYADYAMSEEFHDGLEEAIEIGQTSRIAFMCSEAVWWRCHRRIITDYLLNEGQEVIHIMGMGQQQQAKLNPAAQKVTEGMLCYPQEGKDEEFVD